MSAATTTPETPKKTPIQKPPEARPYVLVDIVLEADLFFIEVKNIGERPAYQVRVRWQPSFRGLGGEQATSELPLFTELAFLAPGRAIRTLLDTRMAYFHRGEPTRLRAAVSYQDERRRKYQHTIPHNLEIYRDLVLPIQSKSSE